MAETFRNIPDSTGGGGGGGTVTSIGITVPSILNVSGSPVTTSGTIDLTLADQSANLVFAGPASGAAATPTFRSLVSADLPSFYDISTINSNTSGVLRKTYLCDTSGGAFNLTLPTPVLNGYIVVKDRNGTFQTNNLTIVRAGSENIEGLAASKIFQTNFGSWILVSDGTDWYLV